MKSSKTSRSAAGGVFITPTFETAAEMAAAGADIIVLAVPSQTLRDNLAAAALTLTSDDLELINRIFPAPTQRTPLTML